jgi:receptor family ligand binding protein
LGRQSVAPRLDPAAALERITALANQGVRVFIGPQSSSEIAAVKAFADSAGVVILSQGSTAGSLSIPDDNVFRLVPDDPAEGAAQVELLREDGIETVVPLWRTDVMAGFRASDHEAILSCLTEDVEWVIPGMFHSKGKPAFDREIETTRSWASPRSP